MDNAVNGALEQQEAELTCFGPLENSMKTMKKLSVSGINQQQNVH